MTKTYEHTKVEDKEFVVETSTIATSQTYTKEWLETEITRLQEILKEFPK